MLETNDPAWAARVASTVEWLVKLGSVFGAAWAFVEKVYPKWQARRRENYARTMREVLKPELDRLTHALMIEDGCAGRMERVLERLDAFFDDHDMLIDIALDNRERHDERDDLLNALGLTSDRRTHERRRKVDDMFTQLQNRRKKRRRSIDDDIDLHREGIVE